ncbi:4-hydroxythreonine-4-phosphate dehydrogenase PdxA [Anaerocolumna xylanovorans]|uniref:4-hydroxythreonine-4-phosphate dehydrogenase n=1 Tax=Anaerocolumna xylanovorans DSM 12503 TaxID=1121345 RepID=A0A1M7Y838_9FIRM|nr:4-hydroxythreonine-4-phosphate dehydrogenase PdxA [Anaerocolumna xylanovorans]SHO48780.1 4-hydroxythreonine-4-phosphate dehydrogenase [Anaerocolumna xylanovorans DSM 12503]
MQQKRERLAITMGDPAGIGTEIIIKALSKERVYNSSIPIVVGDYEALSDAIHFCGLDLALNEITSPEEARGELGIIDFINLGYLTKESWEYKKNSTLCGDAAFHYVIYAIQLAMDCKVDAVITAPINKESINMAGHFYSGHTEIFAEYTGTSKYAMLLASKNLRVIHVSTHVSLREACERVKKARVLEVIELAEQGVKMLGIEKPKIGVAGLNPHCSENGLFGKEEANEILPAIEEAKRKGINVTGPESPDTVFVKCAGGQFDIVVAMYHDQGHIPLKLSGFRYDADNNGFESVSGINCTIGLPIIRVSVDHGTAFGKAGEGRANEESMLDAIGAGVLMAQNRRRNA